MNELKYNLKSEQSRLRANMFGVAIVFTIPLGVSMHPLLLIACAAGAVWALSSMACEAMQGAREQGIREGEETAKMR